VPAAAVLLLLAMVCALAGCVSPPYACTAVGYIDAVTVRLQGSLPPGGQLEACVDDVCATSGQGDSPGTALTVAHREGSVWQVIFSTKPPKALTIRALDAAGAVVAEHAYRLEWKRVGGSAQCGGPMKTPDLTFAVG
jgi:hypothetical protein